MEQTGVATGRKLVFPGNGCYFEFTFYCAKWVMWAILYFRATERCTLLLLGKEVEWRENIFIIFKKGG